MVCMSAFAGVQASHDHKPLLTADGPYIIHSADGSARVVSVSLDGYICDTTYASIPANFSFEVVSHYFLFQYFHIHEQLLFLLT